MSAGLDARDLSDRARETAQDRRFYTELGFTPVVCAACGVEALVKKNSAKHTSVQWSREGVQTCPEISSARTSRPAELVLGCPRLSESIQQAVRNGAVVVPDG